MFGSMKVLRKQCLNQLKAFESYYNKRKEKLGVKCSKRIDKYLNKIKKELID